MTPTMHVLDGMPQDLAIRAIGGDVALLRPLDEMGDEAPPDALPDPIELFVGAVNRQMFPLAEEGVGGSLARLRPPWRAEAERTASWVVHLDRVHPACLRVLYNLLSARDFDSVEVRGTASAPGAKPFDATRAAYPPALKPLPFEVEYEDGIRAWSDRLLQVEFPSAPSDDVVDELSDTITLWCDLLSLGGYPVEATAPREAGVMPEGPLLIDACTVQVAFPELFLADDTAFDAVLNHLYCLTRLGTGIAKVRIRQSMAERTRGNHEHALE